MKSILSLLTRCVLFQDWKAKGAGAVLVLNAIDPKEATREEYVKIVSSLKCSSDCDRLGDIQQEIDYEHKIKMLKQEIEKLKQQKRTIFKPVTEKPSDFVKKENLQAFSILLNIVTQMLKQYVMDFWVWNSILANI